MESAESGSAYARWVLVVLQYRHNRNLYWKPDCCVSRSKNGTKLLSYNNSILESEYSLLDYNILILWWKTMQNPYFFGS